MIKSCQKCQNYQKSVKIAKMSKSKIISKNRQINLEISIGPKNRSSNKQKQSVLNWATKNSVWVDVNNDAPPSSAAKCPNPKSSRYFSELGGPLGEPLVVAERRCCTPAAAALIEEFQTAQTLFSHLSGTQRFRLCFCLAVNPRKNKNHDWTIAATGEF